MKSFAILSLIILILVSTAQAGELPNRDRVGEEMRSLIRPYIASQGKAGGDTINLMAAHDDPTNSPGEPAYFGDFEDEFGEPAWNGWTSGDLTVRTVSHWNVSNYNQPDTLNHAAWCGDISIPSCGEEDPEGGYGARWHDLIEFRQSVPNPGLNSSVTVTATLMYDTEYAYDFVFLSSRYQGQSIFDLDVWTGTGTATVSGTVTYLPFEYLDSTDIAIYFRFKSDPAWDDEDCLVQTAGACQIDDINVHLVNGDFTGDFFEDFENGSDPLDFGIWQITYPDGVGDFAKIWTGLEDIDPCYTNYSPQVAFVDDGEVVPGTGGSECINWCYGPGGYIVNTTGGLAGTGDYLDNFILSPVMDWPDPKTPGAADYDGIKVQFLRYVHEDLSADSPGIFATYAIRSADTDGSAGNGVQDIEDQPWRGVEGWMYGGPSYSHRDHDLTDLMEPGRDQVQLRFKVLERGYVYTWTGNDGYPAPYYDDITVKIFPYQGPGNGGATVAQDNFPTRGSIDLGDLGSHSVRFDCQYNISYPVDMRNDPGDSLVFYVTPVRAGAEFVGPPTMNYILRRNPIFDPFRTSGQPDQGTVVGEHAIGYDGEPRPNAFAFDLPDTGFFFPGDVIHYYFEATDAIGGAGGSDPQTLMVPEDTTGFSTDFDDPMGYDRYRTARALPSIREDGEGGYTQPPILFINDGYEDINWYMALNNIGLLPAEDWDEYFVVAPGSALGNGIGGRANHLLISGYDDILYSSGVLHAFTICNGDYYSDPSNDVQTLRDWMDQGGKDIFLAGDGLVSDMAQSGSETLDFLENYLGVALASSNIRPLIGSQTTPIVRATDGNPVFNGTLETWIAYGGCRYINQFDAVEVFGTGQRIAEFLDPGGMPGQYTFSATMLNIRNPGPSQSRAISMPVTLTDIHTNPADPGHSLAARARLLQDVLMYFGQIGDPENVSPVLPEIAFTTSSFPNPFNPAATIKYAMPKAGHLKLCIYDVRGRLVRTLIDGVRPAGADQTVLWDGTNNQGGSAGSGLYFYEARTGGEVEVGKMTLVK